MMIQGKKVIIFSMYEKITRNRIKWKDHSDRQANDNIATKPSQYTDTERMKAR